MEVKRLMMVGAGFMGQGIAQVSAANGIEVYLWDIKEEYIENALNKMRDSLEKRVSRGKMTVEEVADIFQRIHKTTTLNAAKDADLVIEAIVENKEIKQEMFKKLDKICDEKTIFASNTSAISISSLAGVTSREDRFIGLHFFSPVPAMKLVEIVTGLKTSLDTKEVAMEYVQKVGKTGVLVKDGPGFLVNRLMHAFRQEAFRCLEEGVASLEDIDTAVRLGLGHPLGPFELNDFAGLDIGEATIENLYQGFRDPKWAPNLTLKKLVEAGDLGRKTGKGWYDYTNGTKEVRKDLNL